MATLWRISNYEDLQGIGGFYTAGRWHSQGQRIVYLSEHPALALLEVMANLEIDHEDLPDSFKLLRVKVPDKEKLYSEVQLPQKWKEDEHLTQDIGLNWLMELETPLLRVPSAILPESTNILLNPLHPLAKSMVIEAVIPFPFDERLVQ